MLCPSLAPGAAHCNKTFLKNFQAQIIKNSFFSWTCEPCSIRKDTAAKSDLKHQVEKLAAQMETQQAQIETIGTNVEQLVKTIPTIPTSNPLIQPSGSTQANPWTNIGAVKKLKSSLMIKPHTSQGQPEISVINKLVSDNKLQVHNVGVNPTTGNTYINCPSDAARNEIKTKLQEKYGDYDIQELSEMLPTISIVGITKHQWDIAKVSEEHFNSFTQALKDQNPKLKDLINNGETFKIIFMKPPGGEYENFQIVARVSTNIRDAIRSNWNRMYIGATSAKIYDRFYVKRCYHCNEFGHYANGCGRTQSCATCSAENQHETKHCPHKADPTNHSCVNCKKAGGVSHQGHTASSPKCPSYKLAQKKLKGNTPYYQGKN